MAVTSPDRLWGHPKGLAYLAFAEAWERFSFYGMSALLLLYMLQHILTPGVAEGVAGFAGLRAGVEGLTGPLSNQAFASQVFSLYTGLVYFTPIFGGLLADRWLGQRRTVLLGSVLMAIGHFLMAFEGSFLFAIAFLIAGTGCLKGNISVQVGFLYGPDEGALRTRAFAIFSAAINVGALLGPLLCGVLAQLYGWHVGFGAAGVLMLIALAIYLSGWKHLPADRRRQRDAVHEPLKGDDWRRVAALLFLGAISIPACAAYFQEMNAGLLFIDASVDRSLLGWTVPTASFNALDGLFCILAVPLLIALWRWQARRGREAGEMSKLIIGYLIIAVANLVMIVPAGWADRGESVGAIWPVLLYGLNAIGFTFYWPTLLALFSRAAPAQINSTMMGTVFLSVFLGNLLVGHVATLWEQMAHAQFFALNAAFAGAACVVMLCVARSVSRLLVARNVAENR